MKARLLRDVSTDLGTSQLQPVINNLPEVQVHTKAWQNVRTAVMSPEAMLEDAACMMMSSRSSSASSAWAASICHGECV